MRARACVRVCVCENKRDKERKKYIHTRTHMSMYVDQGVLYSVCVRARVSLYICVLYKCIRVSRWMLLYRYVCTELDIFTYISQFFADTFSQYSCYVSDNYNLASRLCYIPQFYKTCYDAIVRFTA